MAARCRQRDRLAPGRRLRLRDDRSPAEHAAPPARRRWHPAGVCSARATSRRLPTACARGSPRRRWPLPAISGTRAGRFARNRAAADGGVGAAAPVGAAMTRIPRVALMIAAVSLLGAAHAGRRSATRWSCPGPAAARRTRAVRRVGRRPWADPPRADEARAGQRDRAGGGRRTRPLSRPPRTSAAASAPCAPG